MGSTSPLRLLILLALSVAAGSDTSRSYAEPKAASGQEKSQSSSQVTVEAAPAAVPNPTAADFQRDVLPIMKGCTPCHFPGGSMYARLPFDQPQTIHTLGEKLFARIKKEEDQRVIRQFLASVDTRLRGAGGIGNQSKPRAGEKPW